VNTRLEEPKKQIRELVQANLERRRFDQYGVSRNGILLHGPRGTGKTFLAEAVAGEFRLKYSYISAASLLNRFVGITEENIRNVFVEALANQPILLFIDEIDALRAFAAQWQREQKLLAAAAVCVQERFWLPLVAAIAEITADEASGDDAAERLVNSSLLRVLDCYRRRFQLHALLREQVRTSCAAAALDNLQQSHAAALETLVEDWERRWCDCRECLSEIIPAGKFLWERKEGARQTRLTYNGFAVAQRIGELDEVLRILKQEECFHDGHTDRNALDVLQRSYGHQALILEAWGRLPEALALHEKKEAICLELGNKDSLQINYGNQARWVLLNFTHAVLVRGKAGSAAPIIVK
jgi:ATPase family associated with various cellular activities (AAA)